MQTSRPNAALRTASSSRGAARPVSPLDVGATRSPLAAARLATQLGNLSVSSGKNGGGHSSRLPSSPGPVKMRPSAHHRSKSTSSSSARGRSSDNSPAKPSTRTSPSKPQPSRSSSSTSNHARTPSRSQAAALLSKSAGPSTNASRDSLIAAGGLGRMDIVAKDWDSRSGSNSPQKRRPASTSAKKYDRFIPSRENSNSGVVEENSNTANYTGSSSTGKKPRKSDDSFEADPATAPETDEQGNEIGFDDSPPPTPYHQDHTDQAHTAELSSSLGIELGRRILSFASEPPPASNEHSSLLAAYARGEGGVGRASGHQTAIAASQRRRIATTPERVLDAPGMEDDYYLNLLDWSTTNLVAIALSDAVYIWNAESGEVACLCTLSTEEEDSTTAPEFVTSVKFSEDGSYLAIGTSTGAIQIYDLSTSMRIRTMTGHATRVPTLSWSGAILSSGSRDGSIWNSDVRIAQHKIAELNGHRAEVCGLEWRKDTSLSGASGSGGSVGGQGLLASGGNDNVVNVWDGRMLGAPKMVKTNHTAAVKALAWCPWQSSLLATGGGQSDRTVHFWNTTTSARLNSLVTPSQVTSLVFNPHSREILSTHGFPDHSISIWTYPTLSKVIDIKQAHEYRVLHSCINPDGTTIATAAHDENLKFWKVFDLPKKSSTTTGPISALGGAKGGDGKMEGDIGRRGRTGIAIR